MTLAMPECFKRKVWVNRVSTISHQQAEVMHFASFTGFKHDAQTSPSFIANQVMMHRACCKQRTHGHAAGTDFTVRKHHHRVASGKGFVDFLTNAIQSSRKTGRALGFIPCDVDSARLPLAAGKLAVHVLDRGHFFIGQNRMRDTQTIHMLWCRIQQVTFGTNEAFKTHDHFFANRVNRWIGHLSKQLLEVVINHTRLVGEDRQGCIITHRADRILLGVDQAVEHELNGFGGITKRLHALENGFVIKAMRLVVGTDVGQFNAIFAKPLTIGATGSERAFEFFIGNDTTLFKVNQEHLARLKATLGLDVFGVHGNDAYFRCHDHAVVMGDVVT